ncbi:MAG TPA: PEP-CTERM sorting domain-containing protein [Pirellulales bacterium]|nr:PEP-CTERM sorting domain-containing protein [Pirellulales bacterium]
MIRQISAGTTPTRFAKQFIVPFVAVAAAILMAAAFPVMAPAVIINGSTYAAETGGPLPNPASTSYNLVNPTSVSTSIRSDVKWSHAQSWASAYVTPSGVTKTTGGRGWIDTPPTAFAPLYDGKSNLWNAYASGTQLIVNGAGPVASFHFVIPANGIATSFNAQPANQAGDPNQITPPPDGQGIVINGSQGSGSMPSFFDVFAQLDVTAQQGAGPKVDIFHGTFLVDPNTNSFQGTGGFAGITPVITPGSGNSPQFTLAFPTDITGASFDALVGQPFNLQFDEYMTMGDPNHQFPSLTPTPFDFSSRSGGPVGAGGAFAAQFLLDDPRQFTVTPLPEPGSLVLAGIGVLGCCLALRRRGNRCKRSTNRLRENSQPAICICPFST